MTAHLLGVEVVDKMKPHISDEAQKELESLVADVCSRVDTAGRLVGEHNPYDRYFVWKALLDTSANELRLPLWGMPRVCFSGIYHSYEHSMREVVAVGMGIALKNTGKNITEFHGNLKQVVDAHTADACLSDDEVTIARRVRNALAHNGGMETDQLRGQHDLVVENGMLQIVPEETKNLFDLLKVRVSTLVKAALKNKDFH